MFRAAATSGTPPRGSPHIAEERRLMARGTKQRGSQRGGAAAATKGAAPAGAPKPELSTLRMWIDEHWHGWLKPVSGLVLLLVAYLAYSHNLLGDRTEGVAGPLVVGVIVIGTIALSVETPFQVLDKRRDRVLLGVFVALWAVSAGYPALRAALPRKALAERKLGDTKGHLTETFDLGGERGPFEISVGGSLKGSGEVEATYHLVVAGEGSTGDDVSGSLKRTLVHQRVGRRGGTSVQRQERTENLHRLDQTRGSQIKVTVDAPDEQLEDGLTVSVYQAGFDGRLVLALAALCVLVGLLLDYWLASPKVKTYMAMGTAVLLVFAYYYPTEATPRFLVPPAVGGLFFGLLAGMGAELVAIIAKSFKPQPKVKKATR
jgi:hypothetical protein